MKIWIVLLAGAALASSGCFDMPSVYPLYTEQTAMAEPRLTGDWQSRDSKEQMFVRLTGDRKYRVIYIDDKGEGSVWELRVVKLSETPVADMMQARETDIPAHHFLALSFDGATLKVWFLDSSQLRGKAGEEGLAYVRGKKDEVVLTAPSASLAAFLGKNLAEEVKRAPDAEFLALK